MKKKMRRIVSCTLCMILILGSFAGCGEQKEKKKSVTLNIKLAPFTVANPNSDITDAYDMLVEAGEEFAAQYQDADVKINVVKFDYTNEDEYISKVFDTEDAPDILFEGYFNMTSYVYTGRVIPLDDIISKTWCDDIDETYWQMSQIDGKTYMMPFYSMQNTLCYNKELFRQCGLGAYCSDENNIQNWTIEEWEYILETLKERLPDMSYPMMMYAKNEQGDTHTMTLLRAKGAKFFDEDGHIQVNTPEGIEALALLKDGYDKGYFPSGCENLEINDCRDLFNNNQLAICLANNLIQPTIPKENVGYVNFPSVEGTGYNTSFLTGFEVFDNGDADKIAAAKSFLKYFYASDYYLDYEQMAIPANTSVAKRSVIACDMQEAYRKNTSNSVNFTHNNPNWRGVRKTFYIQIHELLTGEKTPEEAAWEIDTYCNLEIDEGLANCKLHD